MRASLGQGGRAAKRWLLAIGIAALAALAIHQYRLIPEAYAGAALTVAQAHDKAIAGDILLIDIRTPREWKATGIPQGALPLDMRRPDFEQALRELAKGDPTRPVAVICARGVRSARLSNQLSQAGFGNIIDVPEGMLGSAAGPGWIGSNLPVERITE